MSTAQIFQGSTAMALLPFSLVAAAFLSALICCGAASSSPIGYGYKLVGLDDLNNGGGVVGHLELIKGTDTYGADIKHLKFIAR